MKSRGVARFRICSILALSWSCAFANAADAQATGADNADIIVTAMKRAAAVQDIPASISVVDSTLLQQSGANDLNSALDMTSGVTLAEHSGTTFLQIRGVGNVIDTGAGESSNALYVDGVFLPRPTMALLPAIDIERVEVLRGPQGTLYGRNATGGAVNIVSRAPSRTLEAGFDVGIGNYDNRQAHMYVSGPLGDTIAVRLSAGYDHRDGFVRNIMGPDYFGSETKFVRGALLGEFGSLTANIFLSYTKRDSSPPQLPLELFPFLPYAAAAGGIQPLGSFLQDPRPNRAANPREVSNPSKTLMAGGSLELPVADFATLRSVTGYIDHKNTLSADDGLGRLYTFQLIRPSKSFSQEFNIFGEIGSISYLIGANYYHENYRMDIPFTLPFGLFVDGGAGDSPPGTGIAQNLREKTNSYSVFADATFSLTDFLRVRGGIRYTHEKKTAEQDYLVTLPGLGTFPAFPGAQGLPSALTDNPVIFRAGIEGDIEKNVLAYASYSQGYKSGGQNVGFLNPADPTTTQFRPERLDAYEAGIKSTLLGGDLIANAAIFRYDYSNLQVLDVILPSTTFINNGDARVVGVEGEVIAKPAQGLTLRGGFTWLPTAKFTRFTLVDQADLAAGPQDLSGKRIIRAPRLTANAALIYTLDLSDTFVDSLTFNLNGRYSSKVVFRPFDAERFDSDGRYAIANFSISAAKDGWTLRGFVNNIFDTAYVESSIYCPSCSARLGHWSEPRTYGATLAFDF